MKITLDIFMSTSTNDTFILVNRWMYHDQKNFTSWNPAAFLLKGGVGQLKFIARKVGVTSDTDFMYIDRISLTTDGDCESRRSEACK